MTGVPRVYRTEPRFCRGNAGLWLTRTPWRITGWWRRRSMHHFRNADRLVNHPDGVEKPELYHVTTVPLSVDRLLWFIHAKYAIEFYTAQTFPKASAV